MQQNNGLSLTHDVKEWMKNTSRPRVLHVFDQACNLINERKDVLSIVTPQIGNGPFNLVIEDEVLFSEDLRLESPVSVFPAQLILGDLSINTVDAKLWNPRPDWDLLYTKRTEILNQLASSSFVNPKPVIPTTLLSTFIMSIVTANIRASMTAVRKLAGLGQGLTPSGDDFIIGAIYAAWVIHPPEIARELAGEILNTAVPLTTSLSAAWIKSAGRGEAGCLWHDLFNAFLSADKMTVEGCIEKILGVGHTSGADALAGCLDVLNSYAEKK